ncbi:MAG: Ankyrin repeat domain-containing protein 11 [Thelocarpon superellum]|nr:MAG: Ankyrin repeat domain-containing protein 11 [Thelocarpon superellum]
MSSPARPPSPPPKPVADDKIAKPEDADVSKPAVHEPSPAQLASSPPTSGAVESPKEPGTEADAAGPKTSPKSDSEAETIVLPGKETDVTPSKRRSIKHDDRDGEKRARDVRPGDEKKADDEGKTDESTKSGAALDGSVKGTLPRKAKTAVDKEGGASQEHGNSSSLSSALSSPVDAGQSSKKAGSESEQAQLSPRASTKEKEKKTEMEQEREREREREREKDKETLISRPRKRKISDGGPEERPVNERPENHGSVANAVASAGNQESNPERRETRSLGRPASPAAEVNNNGRPSQERSTSPHTRAHRRALSSQPHPTVANGKVHKKRKVAPPPLAQRDSKHVDEGLSDDSSLNASPPPSGVPRKLASGDLVSPAKMVPHKKHRDQIGRTFLARACAANEVDNVLIRIAERPEDIDIADNAGNTPLQIASLEGSAEIVKILIDHHCDIDCKNHEKDTPLIDAVENGHLEVVQLLLNAGANPRQGNLNGEEPLDLLNPDDENFEPIRDALVAAKNRSSVRRPSEDQAVHREAPTKENGRVSRGTSAVSPRQSPPATNPRSPPMAAAPLRRKTVRSEVTRNDLLWMKPTAENLRDRAGKGDMAAVANILNVLSQADAESLIAAARGGHDEVIQLLLGIGNADADPPAVLTQKRGYNTPMLAAIGRGNEKVIELLLEQPTFNPTRRDHRGSTYFDIARERQGHNWEKEVELLKNAFDAWNKTHKRSPKDAAKATSPAAPRTHRDGEREKKHSARQSGQGGQPPSSRPEEARRKPSSDNKDTTPLGPPKAKVQARELKKGRVDAAVSSEGEGSKPRRKLVSGKVLKGDRVKRRPSTGSVASTVSAPADAGESKRRIADDGSPPGSGRAHSSGRTDKTKSATRPRSSASDSDLPGEAAPARERSIKKEDAKDRLHAVRSDGKLKRARHSESPDRSVSRESDAATLSTDELKKKRRRLEKQGKDLTKKRARVDSDTVAPTPKDQSDANGRERERSDAAGPKADKDQMQKDKQEQEQQQRITARKERDAAERRAAEQKAQQAKEEKERQERERAEQREREQAEEHERIRQKVEDERKKAEAEERARRIQAEQAEADRRARLAREAEEAEAERRRKAEEAERHARLAREEEQARLERKRRDEEMQRRRVEQERARREEAERRRIEQEQREMMELLKRQEEQERARREALPWALQRLCELPPQQSRTAEEARRFMPLFTVTLAQFEEQTLPPSQAEERWIVNFQAAAVLGVKDFALSQYTAWAKRPIAGRHKVLLWRAIRMKLQGRAPDGLDGQGVGVRDRLTQAKFRAMEPVFWIKLADFEDIIPRYPHLQGLKMFTTPLSLDRKDPERSPVGLVLDGDGWTVTPYHDGHHASYTPHINQQTLDYPSNTALFRDVSEPLEAPKPKAMAVVQNGILDH